MSYRFETDESVRDGFARCAAEQLDQAIGELSERIGEDPVDAVHSARKAIKKERSLLRLVRGSMPAKRRRRENATLRQAARGLSAARDSEAMVDTLDKLSQWAVGQLPESTFEEIREWLIAARDERRRVLTGATLGAQAIGELGAVRLRSETWKLSVDGWAAIEEGLERSYREGRAAYERARSHRDTADWHAWRKRAKDLWYQQRLLAAVAGPTVRGQAKEAHALADVLGDEHDLSVLRRALTHEQITAPVDVAAVVGLIDYRRDELRKEALWIGARVYAEKPKAFIARMRATWKAGQGQVAARTARHPADLADTTHAVHRV